jgi:hypothetical protein
MPTYEYFCTNEACFSSQEEECSINTFKEFKPACVHCGSECEYKFVPTIIQGILKDGPSGSWPSKGEHFKKYRQNKSMEMERRQKDRYSHLNRDVVPNYAGQVTENWREAQSLAMADKATIEQKQTDSLAVAATYVPKIKKEKAKAGGGIIIKS